MNLANMKRQTKIGGCQMENSGVFRMHWQSLIETQVIENIYVLCFP